MSSIADIKEALDITNSTWASYVNGGFITKQKPNEYDMATVAKEIIKYQRAIYKKAVGEKAPMLKRIDKLSKQLTEISGKEEGETPLETKTKEMALEISKQKLIKIKHENSVRKKEVMPVSNVFAFVTTIASEFSAFLDPIVGQIKQQVPDMSARAHDELSKIFARGRNNLSRHIEGKTTHELIHLFDSEASISSTESFEDT